MQQLKDNASERGSKEKGGCRSLLESQDVQSDFFHRSDGIKRRQLITESRRVLSHCIAMQIVFALFTLPLIGPNQTGQGFTSSCLGSGVNQKNFWHASWLFHNQNNGYVWNGMFDTQTVQLPFEHSVFSGAIG